MATKKAKKKAAPKPPRGTYSPEFQGPAPAINPVSGTATPNTFTSVTNREMPAAVRVSARGGGGIGPDGKIDVPTARHNARRHNEAVRANQESIASHFPQSESLFGPQGDAEILGMHKMFPNVGAERNNPAINEPHEADSGITVQRRLEDMSPDEYHRAMQGLVQQGHDPKDPLGSLIRTHEQALQTVVTHNLHAGMNAPSSQLFYGGPGKTELKASPLEEKYPELRTHRERLQAEHNEKMDFARKGFTDLADKVANDSRFPGSQGDAMNMTAQAVADTSPNNKWILKSQHGKTTMPNVLQADVSLNAAMAEPGAQFDQKKGDDRIPFFGGRVQNNAKAANRAGEMMSTGDYDVSKIVGVNAHKTVAFRTALIDRDNKDAFNTLDVHQGGVSFPGLHTGKGAKYAAPDGSSHVRYPDDVRSLPRGSTALEGNAGKANSRVEDAISKGSEGSMHAAVDYAQRFVLAKYGLSRGVNYADNVNALQGGSWGNQQVHRNDVDVSHADQYPVVVDHEASNLAHTQYMANPHTGGITRGLDEHGAANPLSRNFVDRRASAQSAAPAHVDGQMKMNLGPLPKKK